MMMDKFEDQCQNLGVQEAYMEGTMMSTSAMSTPSEQVENLIMQVADEHGLEVKMALGTAPTETTEAIPQEQNDELTQRLNMLRNA
jgi:charged multivesicular body protein 1